MAPQPSLRTVALGWLSLSAGLTTARSVSHQSPTRNDDTAVPQKPVLSHQGSQHPKQPPRNATITLYPGSFDPTRQGSCSPSQPSETVSLAADTCLSGDYYLSTNVELVSAPVCHDGHPPYMAVFPRRACTGPRTWYDYGRTELPTCLDVDKWPLRAGRSEVHDLSWSHWSVMFYCNALEAAMKADGAPRHVTAHPPDLRSGAGVRDFKAGRVEVYATEDACRRSHPRPSPSQPTRASQATTTSQPTSSWYPRPSATTATRLTWPCSRGGPARGHAHGTTTDAPSCRPV